MKVPKDELNQFLKENQEKLFKTALIKVADYDVAMDIVQETMLAMFRKYSNKTVNEWKYLLFKVLRSKIIDWKRKTFLTKLKWVVFDENNMTHEIIETSIESKEFQSELEQKTRLFKTSIDTLSKVQSEVITLKYYVGYSFKDIAAILKISESATKTHYYRAIENMKKNKLVICYE